MHSIYNTWPSGEFWVAAPNLGEPWYRVEAVYGCVGAEAWGQTAFPGVDSLEQARVERERLSALPEYAKYTEWYVLEYIPAMVTRVVRADGGDDVIVRSGSEVPS